MTFTKAERRKAYIKLAITGIAGSGKTYSALRLARGLVGAKGRIAVIDTENNSSTLYDTLTDFDQCELKPRASGSFHYMDFIDAVKEAEKAKYDCVIIDSFSHLWQAILDEKAVLDKTPNKYGERSNSYTNWKDATEHFEKALQTMLQSRIHVIACMRSKQEHIITESKKVEKKGLAPVMRDGIEYEFTTIFMVDKNNDHKATIDKDRTNLFERDGAFLITEETGKKIADWIDGGAEPIDRESLIQKVIGLCECGELLQDDVKNAVSKYGVRKLQELDDASLVACVKTLTTGA